MDWGCDISAIKPEIVPILFRNATGETGNFERSGLAVDGEVAAGGAGCMKLWNWSETSPSVTAGPQSDSQF